MPDEAFESVQKHYMLHKKQYNVITKKKNQVQFVKPIFDKERKMFLFITSHVHTESIATTACTYLFFLNFLLILTLKHERKIFL